MSKKFVFGKNVILKRNRSKFSLNQSVKTTLNVGDLIPIYCQEIYPGDSFNTKTTFLLRTPVPFIKVPMDNLFIDIAFYFVPNRIVYENWKNLMGENTSSAWIPSTTKTTPQVTIPLPTVLPNGLDSDTVASYFGIPKDAKIASVNSLPFRGFGEIYNYWWRDENLQSPIFVRKGDTGSEVFNNNSWGANNYLGKVPKVCKLHDYFTTCLPGTQKGTAQTISLFGDIPVRTSATGNLRQTNALKWGSTAGVNSDPTSGAIAISGATGNPTVNYTSSPSGNPFTNIYPKNLYVDLSDATASFSISDLRLKSAIQRLYELDARGGTRLPESILNHFGVANSDDVMQIPQFLGGRRVPLSITQVNQTSMSDSTTEQFLADVSGYSLSSGNAGYSKSFTEHGFVIGVACVRQLHTYQQGIERFWLRKNRLDYYDPLFAHLSEQGVYDCEIDATHNSNSDTTFFGYQEAFADLRARKNLITGALNSAYSNNLDVWHFGDYYSSQPTLGDAFIKETDTYVNRASAKASTDPNFIIDFYHKVSAIRVLPTFGTPGITKI